MAVRTYAQQKGALTRATKLGRAAVVAECLRTVAEWESQEWADRYHVRRGAWPDDWARWQRTLDDVYPVFHSPRLEDLTIIDEHEARYAEASAAGRYQGD